MLIIFHCFGVFIFQILRNRKRLKSTTDSHETFVIEEVDLENDMKFDPPVYRQRYAKVYEVLIDERWRNTVKKLVDFGCAEFGLFVFIKNLNLEEIFFVDIDEELLLEKIGRIEPLLVDHLRRRSHPMNVSVFAGSVSDPDYQLRKTDVVTAIELIEHLYPDTLDAFPYNIFSFIEPKIVIVTTPNEDFNVLFNRSEGFRHPDHKFEWTREQFKDWSKNIIERFPNYTVDFYGIGDHDDNTKNLGSCSQMALFLRKDVLDVKYISPIYAKQCLCRTESLCTNGNATENKLLCNCVCPFCLPDFSVGVCTYFTRSNRKGMAENDASNAEGFTKYNPSFNIYYKRLEKICYPYEVNKQTDDERLLDTLRYRINTFSHVNSRFHVDARARCEIPVRDVMYGNIDVTIEEIGHILVKSGYQLEKCIIPETGSCETCIISTPREMEEVTSSSEGTDGYTSDTNESTKFGTNVEELSDWDEAALISKENKVVVIQEGCEKNKGATSSSSEDPKEPPTDPLFDSGYLKSPSPQETALKLPPESSEDTETDQFEDLLHTPSLFSDDNKLHLKKSVVKEKFIGPFMPENNKVNELDRFHNMTTTKTFMNSLLKPQNEFKKSPLPIAGPSCSPKKKKYKAKKLSDSEDSPLEDAKSITNCIIQNSLNRIDVGEENLYQGNFIENIGVIEELREEGEAPPIEVPVEAVEEVQVVENGDLANNNRDNEGNNFVAVLQDEEPDEGIDLLNDNLEELAPLLENNVIIVDNNNDLGLGAMLEVAQENREVRAIEEYVQHQEVLEEQRLDSPEAVAHASREALFDPNSEQDLLDDFDVPPQANDENVYDMLNLGNNVVLVGLHPVNSNARRDDPPAASIQTNTNSFPNWLLQILGTHVAVDEAPATPIGGHTEPHFYCQGDGLGVHPSVIAVEIDEVDAEDEDSTESSTNNTADFAEVEPGPSEFDMSSLPEELSANSVAGGSDTTQGPSDVIEEEQSETDRQEFFDSGNNGQK